MEILSATTIGWNEATQINNTNKNLLAWLELNNSSFPFGYQMLDKPFDEYCNKARVKSVKSMDRNDFMVYSYYKAISHEKGKKPVNEFTFAHHVAKTSFTNTSISYQYSSYKRAFNLADKKKVIRLLDKHNTSIQKKETTTHTSKQNSKSDEEWSTVSIILLIGGIVFGLIIIGNIFELFSSLKTTPAPQPKTPPPPEPEPVDVSGDVNQYHQQFGVLHQAHEAFKTAALKSGLFEHGASQFNLTPAELQFRHKHLKSLGDLELLPIEKSTYLEQSSQAYEHRNAAISSYKNCLSISQKIKELSGGKNILSDHLNLASDYWFVAAY